MTFSAPTEAVVRSSGADRVWVANSRDGTVSAIDPQTNLVGTRRLGFRPAAVAVVADQPAVWVALAA